MTDEAPTNTDHEQRIARLDDEECWHRLLAEQVGRLAFMADGRIEVLPLNYVVRGRRIVFRTAADSALLSPQEGSVALEIDGWDASSAWSVVARGSLATDPNPAAFSLEQEYGLAPWAPDEGGPRRTLVTLTVREVHGRSFHRRVEEQEHWYF
jgi:hypothetical protein